MSIISLFKGEEGFPFVEDLCLECIMGSSAYGAQTSESDCDIYAVVVPPKEVLYPGSFGKILGWDYAKPLFESYEHHGLKVDALAHMNQKLDFKVLNIVKFAHMCFIGNPNFLDMLFANSSNILTMTPAGEALVKNRELFVTKEAVKKQAYFARNVFSTESGDAIAYKSAYIAVRALNIAKQFVEKGTADLRAISQELKDVRNGKFKIEDLGSRITNEADFLLGSAIEAADLPLSADPVKVRQVLESAISSHYSNQCISGTGVHQTYHE